MFEHRFSARIHLLSSLIIIVRNYSVLCFILPEMYPSSKVLFSDMRGQEISNSFMCAMTALGEPQQVFMVQEATDLDKYFIWNLRKIIHVLGIYSAYESVTHL